MTDPSQQDYHTLPHVLEHPCNWLEIMLIWKLDLTLSFALCSASDSQHISHSEESRPGLPGSPGGSRVVKNTETSIQIICVLLSSLVCLLHVYSSCRTSHGFQKHTVTGMHDLSTLCFWIHAGWRTCWYISQQEDGNWAVQAVILWKNVHKEKIDEFMRGRGRGKGRGSERRNNFGNFCSSSEIFIS